MTKRQFAWQLTFPVGLLFLYGVIHVVAKESSHASAATIGTLQEYVISVVAAWVAAVFVRRNQHVEALRNFWFRLVPAVQDAVQYTHLPAPTQTDYARTLKGLSVAIDDLRALFENVSELYPYEPLKEIHDAVSGLGFGESFRRDCTASARRSIENSWREVRGALQRELGVGPPSNPVSRFLRG